jgi:hypothetical protein
MYSKELQKLLDRSVSIPRDLTATEAGQYWALEIATYYELWALEELISNLYKEEGWLPERIAVCLGQSKDVFWLIVRGKLSKDVDVREALDFAHAASKVALNFRFELEDSK